MTYNGQRSKEALEGKTLGGGDGGHDANRKPIQRMVTGTMVPV